MSCDVSKAFSVIKYLSVQNIVTYPKRIKLTCIHYVSFCILNIKVGLIEPVIFGGHLKQIFGPSYFLMALRTIMLRLCQKSKHPVNFTFVINQCKALFLTSS